MKLDIKLDTKLASRAPRAPTPPKASAGGRLPIRLHASVLIAFGLIALLLGGSVLPQQVPGQSAGQYAVAGLLGALVFLVSVLAHELAHAVVARRNGVPVKQVTVWALGGTTELDGQPASPGAQFRIAGVGPLASGLAGAALIGLALVTSGLLSAVLGWAGVTNLVLAAFNALPGAPLDGGALVSAAVWKRTGDRFRGTLAAAKAGRLIGMLVLAGGAVQAAVGSLAGGIWLMVIGWFLLATARIEGTRVSVTEALRGVAAEAVMVPTTAAPGWLTVDAFLARVVEPSRQSIFPLAAFDGAPAGVVSLGQLTAVPTTERSSIRAIAVGTPATALALVAPGDPADTLAGRLGTAGAVLVVSEGAVMGLITAADLTRAVALRSTPPGPKSRSNSRQKG